MTVKPTAAERKAIENAAAAIAYLCDCTNWSDPTTWREALKAERKQGLSSLEAKACAVRAWNAGASNPDVAVRHAYHMRPGYLMAYMLGVRHAVERADHDYNGPMFREALAAAAASNDANEAMNRRETY
jgi:hypothetical protein